MTVRNPTSQENHAVRKEFELAALRLNWSQELYSLERMEHGGYLDNYLEMRWQAWQASRSAAIQECAREVLVCAGHANREEARQLAAIAILALKER